MVALSHQAGGHRSYLPYVPGERSPGTRMKVSFRPVCALQEMLGISLSFLEESRRILKGIPVSGVMIPTPTSLTLMRHFSPDSTRKSRMMVCRVKTRGNDTGCQDKDKCAEGVLCIYSRQGRFWKFHPVSLEAVHTSPDILF